MIYNRSVKVFRAGPVDPVTCQPTREEAYAGNLLQFIVVEVVVNGNSVAMVFALVEKPTGEVDKVSLYNLQLMQERKYTIGYQQGGTTALQI